MQPHEEMFFEKPFPKIVHMPKLDIANKNFFCHHKKYHFSEVDTLVNEVLNNGKVALSIEDYLVWTAKHKDLPGEFAKLIYQLCHIVLGLRPPNRQAEGRTAFI